MYDRQIKSDIDPMAGQPSRVGGDDLDLSTLANMLWRGRWILLLCITFATSLGAFYTFRVAVPLYTATTVVVMDTGSNQLMDLPSAVSGLTGDSEEVTTEVEILRSRRLGGSGCDPFEPC